MRVLVLLAVLGACKGEAPAASPAELADRGWRAHQLVIEAGERAASCADAGAAMQRVFAEHRQAFADALALDRDKERLRIATEWVENHPDRYPDLESRMAALEERCAADATVQAVFRQMESP